MGVCNFFESVYIQELQKKPDGFNGTIWSYTDKDSLCVGFILNQSRELREAESVGLRDSYTIMARADERIKHGDVLRRVRDGARYRIVSDFAHTPYPAHEQLMQALALKLPQEEVSL